VRLLFAFDKQRRAILLLGGDKSDDWNGWYKVNIPAADEGFEEHQAKIDKQRSVKPDQSRTRRTSEGKTRKGRR
jgi:hypothetical protein